MESIKRAIPHIEAAAVVEADAAQYPALCRHHIEMDLAIVGYLVAAPPRTLPRIKQYFISFRQVPHGRMAVQNALAPLRQHIGILEAAVVDELFDARLLGRHERSVRTKRKPRVHADPLLFPDKIREPLHLVHRLPIEESAVRKTAAQPFEHGVIVAGVPHEAAVIFQKIILMIARDAICVRHREQKPQKAHALGSLVDDIPQHIERIPAAKADLFQKAAEERIAAVDIGQTIFHKQIITYRPPDFNRQPAIL